jgi:hypothetical protein
MTLANAKAKTNETFIVQASLMIVTYNRQNIFIVQATGLGFCSLVCFFKQRQMYVARPFVLYEKIIVMLTRDKRSSLFCRTLSVINFFTNIDTTGR